MVIFRKLVNESKRFSNNSNFTLQVSHIDGTELNPTVDSKNLLAENIDVKALIAGSSAKIDDKGFAQTFFQFNIGLGLPKNVLPIGIIINEKNIYLTRNGYFTGPRNILWNSVLPILDKSKHELGFWAPTEFFKLLSELKERKIFLEFPALLDKASDNVFGVIPNFGNLKAHLLEKRVI